MCWNSTNNNGNVQGTCRRRRRCICDCDNVAGEAVKIALRGPGCISGTGRCLGETVEADTGFEQCFCGQVSPSGNVQRN